MADRDDIKRNRGVGKGSSFFALGRPIWDRLWAADTVNRLNFVSAFLVLLAGTGSDHRLSKWSLKACDEHAGIGKPRARRAIDELIAAGLVERTESSTMLAPQYRLPELPREDEPIFLPVQLVTGFGSETPILRRVRETGDALLLRMLVDLYGLVETDATHGVPVEALSQVERQPARKAFEVGVHAVWALEQGTGTSARGDWVKPHWVKAKTEEASWTAFWERVATLKSIGAIWYEPWVFDGDAPDAEPLVPVDPGLLYGGGDGDEVTELTRRIQLAAGLLAADRPYLLDRYEGNILMPLALHRRPPAIRGVARMTVEADTPGCRRAYGRRKTLIERNTAAFEELARDASSGLYDRPLRLARPELEDEAV